MKGKFFKRRSGISSVFLTIILFSLVMLVFSFIKLAISTGGIGYSNSVLNLAGRSVLSEFNVHLKEEYGIFAFAGFEPDIDQKLGRYAGYTFDNNKNLKLGIISSTTAGYRLGDTQIFEKEILEYAKYALARGLFKKIVSPKDEEVGTVLMGENIGRTLRNSIIINSLPSGGRKNNVSLLARMKNAKNNISEILSSGTKKYLIDRYIINKFKSRQNQDIGKETFFKFEVEYILYGKRGDKENTVAVKRTLTFFRNFMNFTSIWLDGSLRQKVITAGQILGTDPASELASLTIAEAWALAEAKNDMKILEKGERVPLVKNKDTWAVSIKNIIKNKKVKFINMKHAGGLTYQGYLRAMLYLQENSIKYHRMMDLMQINIQGKYDKDFLVKEHNLGFEFGAEVSGKKYRYEEKY